MYRQVRTWWSLVRRSCDRWSSYSELQRRRWRPAPLLLPPLIVLAACQSLPNYPNRPLGPGAANPPPANPVDAADPSAPLILMAFSGGGSRAAALGLGVLDQLAASAYPTPDGAVKLVDRVKVISSVSGGSVIAAWFGYAGPLRMDELRDGFLARDNMATLEWQAADPITLGRLVFSRYTRIDVLRDLLDKQLFGGATFATLRRPGAPFVMLNATDMESGEVFAFTPQRFDDICSDLGALPLSVGVAASAAFPVALSPMSLRNFRYETCPNTAPAPAWISADLTKQLPRYLDLEEYKRARYANALRDGPPRYRVEHYLHLLDGGIADNQGVHSLTDALISTHSPVALLPEINLGNAKRIVVITVNARSDSDNDVGRNAAVPGLLKVVNTVIGTPIDATTAYANASLQDLVETLKNAAATAPVAPGKPRFGGMRVYGIAIDFDQFLPGQSAMQTAVKSIGTSWTLTTTERDEVLSAGRLLLHQHPCYQRLLLDVGAPDPTADPAETRRDCPFEDDRGP
jgi:NTE family protein